MDSSSKTPMKSTVMLWKYVEMNKIIGSENYGIALIWVMLYKELKV